MKNNATDYRKTKIWKHFEKKVTDPSNKQTVEYLVNYAVPILKEINETFPTYTLHDGQHQLNILNLYADLLGERLSELNGFETAILILSAFYHDIGMVYTEQERENLNDEPLFNDFLKAKPAARLELDKIKMVDDELAEWYCRWAHAKRVWVYLNKLDKKITWDKNNSIGNNFRIELAEVCLSHCEDTDYIKMSDEIASDYWIDTDLKFCAILLRLADILDFDSTRSPVSLYKHLGLDKPKTNSEKISQQEWRKHIASIGFDFRDWSRDNQYILNYKATPDHPAVENDIYEFLDVIEDEIQNCTLALNSCSDRWRNFVLPGKIDRKQVRSQGYTSGAFKFSLDQNQILQLLMGESLYDNPYVFIRELVQNAIDTSRHRVKHEKNVLKNDTYTLKPIEFTDWEDEDGYRWIRIDDYGMGMTKDQIEKYFLKVGNSFYNSDDFKISKLNYSPEDKNFTPISRFGIGILSCFMVADKIEVSTKSVYCGNERDNPIRLSLSGLQNYYFLYTDRNIPKSMPRQGGNENGYRKEEGTSIAIRLKHNFNRDYFELHSVLESLIYCSEIPIKYESTSYGEEKIENLPTETKTLKISPNESKRIIDFIDDSDITEINPEIHRIPIKLSDSRIINAKGYVYVFLFAVNITYKSKINKNIPFGELGYGIETFFHYEGNKADYEPPDFSLKIERDFFGERYIAPIEIDLSELIEDIWEFNGRVVPKNYKDGFLFTHNGVILPNVDNVNIHCIETKSEESFCLGIINLKDELRPNLNISRSRITSFSWELFSKLNFLLRISLDNSSYKFKSQINHFVLGEFCHYAIGETEIMKDQLLYSKDGWRNVLLNRYIDLLNNKSDNSEIEVEVYQRISFNYLTQIDRYGFDGSDILNKNIIFINFNYKIELYKEKANQAYILQKKAYVSKGVNKHNGLFPMHYACEYINFEGLMPEELNENLYNINHQLTKWLIATYSELLSNFNHQLRGILQAKSIGELNYFLDKLKKILPEELKPNFTITKKDFEVDFDQLEELPKNED